MILEVDHMGPAQVFCSIGEAEVYGLIKRSKVDLVLILETKLGSMLRDLYQSKRTGQIICAVKGQGRT